LATRGGEGGVAEGGGEVVVRIRIYRILEFSEWGGGGGRVLFC
jgi:hypothetical protein